ncbi:hypothetical protein [Embleya sp. NPDC050493]|uniref:hypothetical protein n=1 Tax=Embleya sp. NPDC050493 TaxID=3363989 RepID=UPI0037A1E14F
MFAEVVRAVDALVEARRDLDPDAAVAAARRTLRAAVRQAWAGGIPHHRVLGLLHQAGLGADDPAAAGYDPGLLRALDRAAGFGRLRPST